LTPLYVIDTHALLWWLTNDSRHGTQAGAVMDDKTSQLALPVIALAEACWIVERGRVAMSSPSMLVANVTADPRFRVIPLTRSIVERSLGLATVGEMHDRLIVATTLFLNRPGMPATLLTKDANITASALVNIAWS
jgi:PIN domain nuclease of toxin-antitoxin system